MNLNTENLIKNPFNYCGGKYKLLPQLEKHFPNDKNIITFIDLFAGGGDVSFNVNADKIIYNDKNSPLISILENIDNEFINEVENLIDKYMLSKTNREGFLELRKIYNENVSDYSEGSGRKKAVMLYTLLCYSFNNQIGFNRKGEFNVPFGLNRSEFNLSLKEKLQQYINRKEEINIDFMSLDFNNFDFDSYNPNCTFIYLDPPYLISTGAYQRCYDCKWNEAREKELLSLLKELDCKGYKWALSNVVVHKGLRNHMLIDFAQHYNLHNIDKNYKNCSYQCKSNDKATQEILLTNY